MKDKRQLIPAAGLLAIIIAAVYMVGQLSGQTTVSPADLTNAAVAEVRNAEGQTILRGSFQVIPDDDREDVERNAALAPTGVDEDATGEAEVEFRTDAPAEQEVEFSVKNVPPDTVLIFLVDGTVVATATADRRGRAEAEADVPMPASPAVR